jgi:ArsR family transcriptional regulator
MPLNASSIIDALTTVNGRKMTKLAMTPVAGAATQCCPSVLAAPLGAIEASTLADGFSALSDPVRLRVLSMLAASTEGELCVCEFVEPLAKSQPTVSHHLKVLSAAGLVHGERRGKWVWYSLNRVRLAELRAAIDT